MQQIGCDVGDGFSMGSVIHEIGHAAGYFHEQQRPDRDQFVTVNEGNIEDGKESNFEIRMGGVILGPYDYGSIMHYSRDAFAVGGDTIVPPPGVEIGQREALSARDILGVCVMYGAPHFVVAFEDDGNIEDRSNVLWAGLTRWGKYCWQPVPVSGGGGNQRFLPNVGIDADRTSVVVWQDGRNDGDVRARCLAVNGAERFDVITVASGGGHHSAPDLAMSADGNFVVVWQTALAGGGQEIRVRGFDRRGIERFAEGTVSAGDGGVPGAPAVGMDGMGGFVVVWGELVDDSLAVRARGFRFDGAERFPELTVAEGLGDQDVFPRVGVASDGSFVVVWERGMRDVRARGFRADGSERFGELAVNMTQAGDQLLADVAMMPNGRFVVVWTDDRNQNNIFQLRARIFNADGTEAMGEFTVNPRGGGEQLRPRVAIDRDGRMITAWEDDEDRNGFFQIHATGLDATGVRFLRSVTVNTEWMGQQRRPAVTSR